MKRFTSILCALCLVVGVLSGVALAPTVETKASVPPENEIPGVLTFAYFSDEDKADDWDNRSQIKVVSGSAITVSASPAAFSIGGKTQWNHGVVIIEPQDGWSYAGATYHTPYSGADNGIDTASLNDVFETLKTNAGGESKLPQKVKDLIQSYNAAAASLTGAYINRGVYTQSDYFTVSFVKNGVTQNITIPVNTDELSVTKTYNYNTNDVLDVFGVLDAEYPDVLRNGFGRSDYEIKIRTGSHTPMSISQNWSGSSDQDYGKYTIYSGAGQRSFVLTNGTTGVSYILHATFVPAAMPLHFGDFTFSAEVDHDFNGATEDLGDYYLLPKTVKAFSEFEVSFSVPDGTTLDSVKYENKDIPQTTAATLEIDADWDDPTETPRNVSAVYTVSNSTVTVKVTSVDRKVALAGSIVITLSKNGEEYPYSLSIGYKRTPEIGGMSRQLIPVAAGSTLKLSDLIYIKSDSDKQLLYEGITNGKITLAMQGVVPKFENGQFNGLLTVYYPCDRLVVWDNEICATITACGAEIKANASTLIEAGSVLDIDSLLPGYSSENKWDSKTERVKGQNVTYQTTVEKVNHSYGYTLSQDERYFTAPSEINGIVTYVIHAYLADITVRVCPKGTLASSLSEVAKTISADEALVVETGGNASVSKETINNFKENGGDNSSITIRNNKNSHAPEWIFNKNDLLNAASKDINLSVAVGDEVTSSRLNKIGGLKLGFAANGTLPGKTGVRFYLTDSDLSKFTDPNHIGLFYDDGTSSAKREGRNLYVAVDIFGRHYIDISVTHNSDFVLTSVDAESISLSSETSGGGSGYSGGSGTDTVSSPETTETTAGTDKETKTDKEEDKNATVTENEDGSVTKSTVTENEDGSKTTVDETEFKDGSKAVTETTEKADGTEVSKTVVTDEKGKFVSETVAEESVTKKGTKVEESTTTYADGSTEYNKVKTTKSGKVEETTVKLDKNRKGTIELETTKKDGTSESAEFSVSKSGVVRVTNFETEGTKATVPETVPVDGKDIPVTIIGKNAFAGSDVEKVTIGANITTIGVGAFNDASSLKSIVFKAAAVTKVYKGAFDGIAEDAVITIKAATKKEYNRLVKLIKKSGVAKSVKFKRSK